tara:strand:+ start:5149 stop:5808 length:660 start_codon:yes stop_codon:yes gene_type:complete
MPFKGKGWLANELSGIIDNDGPLTGKKLAGTLSKFSLGIIPPTLGIITGKLPAIQAYNSAAQFDKIKGIEDAVNAFAKENATGMSTITGGLFTGIAPPPLKGTKRLFEFVKKNNMSKTHLCKTLAAAIWVNWTLGKSTFNPLSIPIPTWNIPGLPGSVKDEIDEAELQRDAQVALQQAEYENRISDQAGPDGILGTEDDLNNASLVDSPEFFEQSNRSD